MQVRKYWRVCLIKSDIIQHIRVNGVSGEIVVLD